MKLFLVHCGFYDMDLCDGIFEGHVNFFVVAENFEGARAKAKTIQDFQNKRMHVDGIQEIQAVDGYRVDVTADAGLDGKTVIVGSRHRDLAPKPKTP